MANHAEKSFIPVGIAHSNENELTVDWTAEDERRIRWKLDLRIVPAVFLLYLLCFIDR